MICGAVASRLPVTRAPSCPWRARTRPRRPGSLGGIAQLARPAALADPVGRRAARPVDGPAPGVALQADDVVEAELAEKVEQLGVGQAGQDGDPDAGGQHLGQPTQAGILIVVAGAPGQKPRHGSERNYLWRPTL